MCDHKKNTTFETQLLHNDDLRPGETVWKISISKIKCQDCGERFVPVGVPLMQMGENYNSNLEHPTCAGTVINIPIKPRGF